jgi:hypothetical protein
MVSPERMQVGCQVLGWQVIEIKDHVRGRSEAYVPDDGHRPHPGKKARLLTTTNGRLQRRKNGVPEEIRLNLSVNNRCSAAIFITADV